MVPYRKPGGRKARTPQSQRWRLASPPTPTEIFRTAYHHSSATKYHSPEGGFGRFGAWRGWDGDIRSFFAPHRDGGPRLSFLCRAKSEISPTAPLLSPAGWANQRVLYKAPNRFVLVVEWLAGRANWRAEDGKPGAWMDQFHRCTQLNLHYSGRWRLENHRIRWPSRAGGWVGHRLSAMNYGAAGGH